MTVKSMQNTSVVFSVTPVSQMFVFDLEKNVWIGH
jgi:hypothetical protein